MRARVLLRKLTTFVVVPIHHICEALGLNPRTLSKSRSALRIKKQNAVFADPQARLGNGW